MKHKTSELEDASPRLAMAIREAFGLPDTPLLERDPNLLARPIVVNFATGEGRAATADEIAAYEADRRVFTPAPADGEPLTSRPAAGSSR